MLVRDQIHGDMTFNDYEQSLIETPIFERLRYIKQLGFAEYEYPGATHTRYQHSLGVCQCITDMYLAVCKNSPEFYRDGDLELLRYMALVHDLGHAPFSHASEDLSTITHEERLKDILELLKDEIVFAHDYPIEAWELVYQVYLGTGAVYFSSTHLMTLHTFMDGLIDADKLDYLERDAVNCGVAYGKFDRLGLINNLCIVRNDLGIEVLGIKQAGVQALESFVLARYYMFNQVYMHPDERLLRHLALVELQELLPNNMYPSDIKQYLKYDDTKFNKRLKCLKERRKFALAYDGVFDFDLKQAIEKRLKNYVFIDTPQKTIFRNSVDSPTILVKTGLGLIVPCESVSPILDIIKYTNIYKLRVYTAKSNLGMVQDEIRRLVQNDGK